MPIPRKIFGTPGKSRGAGRITRNCGRECLKTGRTTIRVGFLAVVSRASVQSFGSVPKPVFEMPRQLSEFAGVNGWSVGVPKPHGFVTVYCTAMVTVLEGTPPAVSTTGTASPVGAFAGTFTFTW